MSVQRFLRDARAGAALVSDHVWLVDQRDALKAATVAATEEMTEQLNRNPGISDAALRTALASVAERYILLNLGYLPAERFQKQEDTLDVQIIKIDRSLNTVDVAAAAQMGGTLFAATLPIFGDGAEPRMVRVEATVESVPNPVEVVLALDISQSMVNCLDGRNCQRRDKEINRLSLVKRAAEKLVDILDPRAGKQVAIGVVPWHTQIRLGPDAVSDWETKGWAAYPRQRRFPVPWFCGGGQAASTCTPPPGQQQVLPQPVPEAWEGCLDEDRVTGLSMVAARPAPAGLLAPPGDSPFAQGIFHSGFGFAFNCLAGTRPANFNLQLCFDTVQQPSNQYVVPAQHYCRPDNPAILPLSSDRPTIEQAIADLDAIGLRTYSALGVLWGQRLLTHSWKDAWGGFGSPRRPRRRREHPQGHRHADGWGGHPLRHRQHIVHRQCGRILPHRRLRDRQGGRERGVRDRGDGPGSRFHVVRR